MMFKALCLALTLLIVGCATVEKTSSPAPGPTVSDERVVDRSYQLGKEQSVFVGGTLARVKDYILQKTTRQGAMHASTDFSLFLPPIGPTLRVSTKQPIALSGTTIREGAEYRTVKLPGQPYIDFLITADGRFEGSGINAMGARMGWNYTPDPISVVLRPDTSTSTISESGYLNFELIYSGVTKDSIRLLYREYTQRDLVRPAFTQDLVYERDSSTIRFRTMLIKVLQATGEQLRFVVLEDGYPVN